MAIKINTVAGKNGKPYPKLMQRNNANGTIVLFTAYQRGVMLDNPQYPDELGMVCSNFNMLEFKDFTGTVTLTQD